MSRVSRSRSARSSSATRTYLHLKKMEDYAQDLAELVVRYFKEKDLEVRKDLILKSVEVLKLNPPPGLGSALNHGRS